MKLCTASSKQCTAVVENKRCTPLFYQVTKYDYNYLGLVFQDLYKVTAVQRVIVSAVDNS